ncbi:hypothetical protein PYW08_007126 [Mythimna loreyi]|uniref:Uncharacterized protein n=1 Tax=Mythimna loreyi TaxID=667449 RepID=A0ACC2R8T8_9NEOP|nr:hypothetical protein PYW08_007126 [Mythimna loreyi]
MRVSGSEQQTCPCYKGSHQDFQKLVELKDSSLVIYCYKTHTEDIHQQSKQDESLEGSESTSRDVFIIHNRKDTRLSTSQLTSELEKKNISCPRCRKIFEHAQELMQEINSIEKNIVIGICDHCRKKAQTQFCVCDKIVRKFKFAKSEQKENVKKHVKTCLSKMEHILKDAKTFHKSKQIIHRAYSDLQINQDLKSSTSRHQPEIQHMFGLETNKSDISVNRETGETVIKEDYFKQGVTFSQPLISTKPVATSASDTSRERENVNTMIPRTSLMEKSEGIKELPRTSLKDRKKEKIVEDTPSMDAKDALKRRHDLSLRQMMRHEKNSEVLSNISKKPTVHEIPKIAPWEQKEPTTKYHEDIAMDINKKNKHDTTRHLTYSSKTLVKYGTSKKSHSSLRDSYEQKKTDKFSDKKRSKSSLKSKKLEPQVSSSKSRLKKTSKPETGVDPQFSFFFPKIAAKKETKQKQLDVRSSHLIKHTQEKFRRQAEKKRQEKERKEKERQEKERQEKERQEKERQQKERQQKIDQRKISRDKQDILYQHKKDSKKDLGRLGVDEDEKQNKAKIDKSIDDTLEKKLKSEPKENAVKKEQAMKTEEEKRDVKIQKEKEILTKKIDKEKETKRDSASDLVSVSTILKKKNKNEIFVNDEEVSKINELIGTKIKTTEGDEKRKENEETLKQIEQLKKEKEINKKQAEKEHLLKNKDAPSKTDKSKNEIAKKQTAANENETIETIQSIEKRMKIEERNEKKAKDKEQKQGLKRIQQVFEHKDVPSKTEKKVSPNEQQNTKQDSEFLRLQVEQSKQRALERQKQLEEAKEKERKLKELAELKEKAADLKIDKIKMEPISNSDYLINLVRLKQAAEMKPADITPVDIQEHKCHHGINIRFFCPLCYNSELEMEIVSLDNKKSASPETFKEIIIGEKIFKIKHLFEKSTEPEVDLNLYQNFIFEPLTEFGATDVRTYKYSKPKKIAKVVSMVSKKREPEPVEPQEPGKGILRYALSDRTFIDKGWTVLPTEKVVRKLNVYRMRPAHPEFDWFEHNKKKRLMTYDTGERLAEFEDNGRGRWYYRSGRLALDYYDAEEANAQQRFVIYSSGEPDERGRTHPITILATFDYLGNGIVFDHAGKIRLKYNQTEGVVLDRAIGPVSHWKWHTLNDPPVLQQVMIDTQLPQKDPEILKLGPHVEKAIRPDNEEMIAIEFDNFIKEKSKKLSQKFKPFQIKMKALKINEHFSLKVLDQATVYLIFRDGSTNLKLNIGMILDHKEIVDTETAEVGEVSNSIEQFPARTDSLAGLQRSVAHAQRYERQQTERERRLRPAEPCASVDLLSAAVSPPMRVPLRTMPSGSTPSTTGYCSRKPTNNLYYNTRLL